MRARFLEEAEEEMYEAAAFYEGRTDGLGDRFLDDIEACVDRIAIGRRWDAESGSIFGLSWQGDFPFPLSMPLRMRQSSLSR